MNREIKFRAWDSIAGKMWEDVYFDGGHIYTIGPDGENASTMPRWEDNAIMQFTGLLDKNGKEIFENDVVAITRHGDTINHAIVYQSGAWRLEPDGPYPTRYICEFNSSIIEVIGNIHENKELLE